MNTVRSKYKNPDKLIEQLKRKIQHKEDTKRDTKRHYSDLWRKELGVHLLHARDINDSIDKGCCIWGDKFDGIEPGDVVSIDCEVTKVIKGFDCEDGERKRDCAIKYDPIKMRLKAKP